MTAPQQPQSLEDLGAARATAFTRMQTVAAHMKRRVADGVIDQATADKLTRKAQAAYDQTQEEFQLHARLAGLTP